MATWCGVRAPNGPRRTDGRTLQLYTLDGHVGAVNLLAFSPDGNILASGSYDKVPPRLRAPRPRSLPRVRPLTHAVYACEQTIKTWDMLSGEMVRSIERHAHYVTALVRPALPQPSETT
jgi:WD40 repeat protein